VKLLWKNVLKKVENRLDEISSSFINKVWKELCQNEKYTHICHVENDVMKKTDNIINSFSKIETFKKTNSKRTINKSSCSSSSSLSSPSNIENSKQINDNISHNTSVDSSSLSIIDNNIINSNLSNLQLTTSQQLNISSKVLHNPINNRNNYNSQINSIHQTFTYDSLNSNYNSNSALNSLHEQNNNSQIIYYSVPVTIINSSNYNKYSMINKQTYSQTTVPVTSSNTIYYMVNPSNQQSVITTNAPTINWLSIN